MEKKKENKFDESKNLKPGKKDDRQFPASQFSKDQRADAVKGLDERHDATSKEDEARDQK